MPISNITREIISFHFKIFQLCVMDLIPCHVNSARLMFFASSPNMVLFVVATHLSLFRFAFVWCLVVSNLLKWICPLIFQSIILVLVDVFYVNYLTYTFGI